MNAAAVRPGDRATCSGSALTRRCDAGATAVVRMRRRPVRSRRESVRRHRAISDHADELCENGIELVHELKTAVRGGDRPAVDLPVGLHVYFAGLPHRHGGEPFGILKPGSCAVLAEPRGDRLQRDFSPQAAALIHMCADTSIEVGQVESHGVRVSSGDHSCCGPVGRLAALWATPSGGEVGQVKLRSPRQVAERMRVPRRRSGVVLESIPWRVVRDEVARLDVDADHLIEPGHAPPECDAVDLLGERLDLDRFENVRAETG